MDADEARACHLVSSVVDGDVMPHALDLARTIAVAPRSNLMRTKEKALRDASVAPDRATLDL